LTSPRRPLPDALCGLIRDQPAAFPSVEVAFPAHLLSLDRAWLDVVAIRAPRFGPSPAVNGMSGSPLISTTGAAIGVVSTNNIVACLVNGLPGWLLRELR
jgi:hypothetical protein